MLLNLTTSAMGTAVGLSTDLTTGAIDRFRTLPMWRSAVLVGRSMADVLSAALCVGIVALTGLAIGWRPGASAASVLAGFGVALLFSYALSWGCACLGIVSQGPGVGPGRRAHHPVPAGHRLQRHGAHPGHARLAAGQSPTGTRSAR